ncbi:hypothetical protein HZC09_02150 [Candidatus Micrarchaeota archaeon]|nr:hypothetical protein [Candidatus Micrarchaeota archaeon]
MNLLQIVKIRDKYLDALSEYERVSSPAVPRWSGYQNHPRHSLLGFVQYNVFAHAEGAHASDSRSYPKGLYDEKMTRRTSGIGAWLEPKFTVS